MRFALEMLMETDERDEQERLWQMMNMTSKNSTT
jgi:hypothetical protein